MRVGEYLTDEQSEENRRRNSPNVIMAKKWYVVHAKTNQEENVKVAVEHLIGEEGSNVFRVVVPTEEVTEIIKGQKKEKSQKFYPGYIFVEMDSDNEETRHKIRTTSNVLGILGEVPEDTIQPLLAFWEEKKKKPTPKEEFEKGQHVEIKEGPFANFNGVVEEVNPEKGKVKVGVFVFGRDTRVELEYWQVEKI